MCSRWRPLLLGCDLKLRTDRDFWTGKRKKQKYFFLPFSFDLFCQVPFVISPQEQAVRALDPRNAFRFAQKHALTQAHKHTHTHTHTQTQAHAHALSPLTRHRLDLSALLSVGHPASWRHVWLKFQWQINKQTKENNAKKTKTKTQKQTKHKQPGMVSVVTFCFPICSFYFIFFCMSSMSFLKSPN